MHIYFFMKLPQRSPHKFRKKSDDMERNEKKGKEIIAKVGDSTDGGIKENARRLSYQNALSYNEVMKYSVPEKVITKHRK